MELDSIAKKFIDFTQYSTFLECPLLWYERYVQRLTKKKELGRGDGTRIIGSLVHKGLESLHKTGQITISQEYMDEIGAAPEALYTARTLLQGYLQNYAGEKLLNTILHTEEPLKGTIGKDNVSVLAKIDTYGEITETTPVQTDTDGTVYLEPGYWVVEHKTKAAEFHRPKYAQGWVTNMQVDFQMIVLEEYLRSQGMTTPVQGVIINVLEKPRNARPTRKCRKCGAVSDYSAWVATEGGHKCPWCEAVQKLTPLGDPSNYAGDYYRIVVPNPVHRREDSLRSIENVWWQMRAMELSGPGSREHSFSVTNYRSCVHPIYGACEFFEPHAAGTGAEGGQLYEIKEDPLKYTQEDTDV